MQVVEKTVTPAITKYLKARQSIGFAAEEAIQLGEVTSPGWFFAINRDASNFIVLRTASSGTIFAKLLPGEFCFIRIGSGAQAPTAQADTGVCVLEYVVVGT